ncbi:hypothetical protein D0A34_02715 [Microcoleus vaginatus PCC 9802]|nr:hypothetical protein D0A34_02715 [Microcoleus vaginatus PCC 9802]
MEKFRFANCCNLKFGATGVFGAGFLGRNSISFGGVRLPQLKSHLSCFLPRSLDTNSDRTDERMLVIKRSAKI